MKFIKNPRSLFYFGFSLLLLGILWVGYSLVTNSFTQIYGWDYQSQYLTMAYGFHDTWQLFFKTGQFELYDASTYLGVDNIGANAYYGLFDPFMLIVYWIFPRAWMPQMLALATVFKGMVGGLAMRWYCRYLGLSENASRLAGLAYAFNGWVNFMVGFPTMVSAAELLPLGLLGIERILKEKKPAVLAVFLLLLGMSCFFYLVVFCLFGVFYAMIRYFMTWKARKGWKDHLSTIGVGVFGFAVGLMLGAWVLFPSLRESSLSGRTTSIGTEYLNELLTAIQTFDIGAFLSSMFQMVGHHPMREMQGITSFLFPTVNYLWLPLAKDSGSWTYDAWTASIFSYTPIVILFFIAIFSAIRRKKWGELAIFALCCYLVFTNFAYYFFYAFAGDGYGRWYMILVPLIIFYGARELDRLKEEKPWVIVSGCSLTLAVSIVVVCLYAFYFNGSYFDPPVDYSVSYWHYIYQFPAIVYRNGVGHSLMWVIYYQLILYGIASVLVIVFRKKDWMPKILMGMVAVETIVSGNCSFFYGSSYSYQNSYNGGASFANAMTARMEIVNEDGEGLFYRVNIEGLPDKNSQIAFGANGMSVFSSLFNYETAALNAYSRLSTGGWSAYYNRKRLGLDTALGVNYYVVRGEGYGGGFNFGGANVPWDSEEIYADSTYKVFRSGLGSDLYFSWMGENVYRENNENLGGNNLLPYRSDWYSGSSSASTVTSEVTRNEEVYLTGSIIKDEDASRIEELGLDFESTPRFSDTHYTKTFTRSNTTQRVFSTADWYTYYGSYNGTLYGPTAFYDEDTRDLIVESIDNYSIGTNVTSDFSKIVIEPTTTSGYDGYFNEDPNGAYFAFYFPTNSGNARVYFIGDTFNEDGTVAEENALLSYEYRAIADGNSSLNVNSSAPIYGFYPEGRVKAIVILGKPSERTSFNLSGTFDIRVMERRDYEAMIATLKENSLKNVVYTTDRFEGEGSFSHAGIMNTTLAYDDGWTVTLVGEEGRASATDTFNVNGGLLGYYVPQGDWTVVLKYETPYMNVSAVFFSVGFLSLVGYYLCKSWLDYKKGLREETLTE